MTREELLERIQKRWSALSNRGDCTCARCFAQEALIALTEDGLRVVTESYLTSVLYYGSLEAPEMDRLYKQTEAILDGPPECPECDGLRLCNEFCDCADCDRGRDLGFDNISDKANEHLAGGSDRG